MRVFPVWTIDVPCASESLYAAGAFWHLTAQIVIVDDIIRATIHVIDLGWGVCAEAVVAIIVRHIIGAIVRDEGAAISAIGGVAGLNAVVVLNWVVINKFYAAGASSAEHLPAVVCPNDIVVIDVAAVIVDRIGIVDIWCSSINAGAAAITERNICVWPLCVAGNFVK